jgi:hypothetical protein
MPENIEASLNWPETGLRGVPAPGDPLLPPVVAPTGGGNGAGNHAPKDGSEGAPGSLYDPDLQQGMAVLTQTVRELAESVAAARRDGGTGADTSALGAAEDSLRRVQEAAASISLKLDRINHALDEGHGLRTELAFGTHILADEPAPAISYKGGIPGINTKVGVGSRQSSAVTWPPWSPPHKMSVWSRFFRSNIAVPLLLLAVIGVSAVAYKVVEHEKALNAAAPAAVVQQQGISSYGSVKVISGTTCRAGTTTATLQLAAAQERDGTYLVSVAGTLSNGATTNLSNVVVGWDVTYADGYMATEKAPVGAGAAISGKSTKTFYALAPTSDGSVPPIAVSVSQIGATPAQPACS